VKILHKYVLKEHVGPLAFALTALTSLLLLQYIAKRFEVGEVPSLALVMEKKIVARLEGRATMPSIESMLDSHLEAA